MCVKLKDVEGKLVSALYPILRDKRDIPIKGFHLFFIIGTHGTKNIVYMVLI
jgi:hypothetical protein